MMKLHKFDLNPEHTILPCRSILAVFSKLYLVTCASFWQSTLQMRMCVDYIYYSYMLKVFVLLELCVYIDMLAKVMDLLSGNLISWLLGHLLSNAQPFDGNTAT